MVETRKPKPKIWLIAAIALITTFAACLSVIFLIPAVLFGGLSGCPASSQSAIEGRIHIDFPPSAKNIDCGYFFFQGSEAWARFEMSPSDLDTFLATTYVTSVTDQPVPDDVEFHFSTMFVRDHLYGEYRGEWIPGELMQQYILIDIDDPNTYIVFFQAWF
jgi:hypothetical protein